MHTLEFLTQIVLIVLALLAGRSLAVQGIAQGRAWGGLDITILKRRFVLRTRQVYRGKVYFQAALLQAA